MIFADKHSRRDKHLLRLERELDRLRLAQWDAPVIPLAQPYQRGWVKSFTLREDAGHHPESAVFRAVLAIINHSVWHRMRDFRQANGDIVQLRPRIISPGRWRRLAWSVRHQRLFARGWWDDGDPVQVIRHRRVRLLVFGHRLMSDWWLQEVIRPHMITHQRVDLPEVRSRIAEIENYLNRCQGRARLSHLHGRRVWWREWIDPISVRRDSPIPCLDQPD